MSQESVELDVCMVAHGVGPATIGGVTRWSDALARDLPALRIGLHRAGDELPPARCYHALMPSAVPAASASARARRRPVILTVHAMGDPWEPENWRRRFDPQDVSHGGGGGGRGGGNQGGNSQNAWIDRTYGAVDRIVAVGSAVAASHRAAAGRDIQVIANGVAAGRRQASRDEPVVGFVGRLAPIKRLERLLEAMEFVREVNREARLVLVGPDDGPARVRTRAACACGTPGSARGGRVHRRGPPGAVVPAVCRHGDVVRHRGHASGGPGSARARRAVRRPGCRRDARGDRRRRPGGRAG